MNQSDPEQGKRLCQQLLNMEASPSPLSSRADDLPAASQGRNEHGKAVFAIQAQRAGTKNQPSPEGLGP